MNYSSVIKVPDENTLDALCTKTFNQLMIHRNVILRIRDIDYKLPTAIQAGALPLALSGKDLIVQSPPGSGKTLVFAALAAHILYDNHQSQQREPFVTILAASSEHVTKIKNLIIKLVPDGSNVCAFYGDGDDFTDEKIAKRCSIVIGTPDRMAKLCADGGITIKLSQLLIIDDADKLMAPTFVENIQSVFENRGSVVQVAAFCSSYPDGIERFLRRFMESPSIFRIDRQDVQLSAANRDDKVDVKDNTPETDDGIATSQSDQLLKNVSSNEPSASPTKTLLGSSANVDEPPVVSQSTNAKRDEPSMASQSSAVQLSPLNRDDEVAVEDNTLEINDIMATSQSDQLLKKVSLNEPSASLTKTLLGSSANVGELPVESQSTNAKSDEPSVGDEPSVELSPPNRDDKVAVKDNTPETDDGIAASQSEQLSKQVSLDESSASAPKTSSGGRQDVQLNATNRDDKIAIEDTTLEIDRDVKDNIPEKATFQSDQLSKTSNEPSAFPIKTSPGSSRNANFNEPSMASQSAAVQLSPPNLDNNVAIEDKTPETDDGIAASQSEQLSKNISSNEPSAFPTKTTPGGSFGQSNGFGAQNSDGGQGFGSTCGGSRGGFGHSDRFGARNNGGSASGGFGAQNNGGFGSTSGGRGGFGHSNGYGAQNNDISFGSTRRGSRSELGQSNGYGAQNNDSGFGSTRGGNRGGFGQSNGYGAQNNDSGFGSTHRGSRSGFGGGGNRGGYNRSIEFGGDKQMSSSRGSFGTGGGGFGKINNSDDQMNSSRGGFGRASRGNYGHGGFDQSNDNSNGFGENQMNSSGSYRDRGRFGNLNSAENQMSLSSATRGGFGGGRGGFDTSNSALDQINSSGSNRGFRSRDGSFGDRGGFGTSDSAENQINSSVLNRGGNFHSNYDQSSHGGFGSGFGQSAADNSQDVPAPEDKPQPLVLGHRFVR
uniref:ATP-dependent RNA helicase n=1 Tax=Panagrolaimus sp. PS1159 TaxID=55785 RepID=A0AC35FMW0_9BILA